MLVLNTRAEQLEWIQACRRPALADPVSMSLTRFTKRKLTSRTQNCFAREFSGGGGFLTPRFAPWIRWSPGCVGSMVVGVETGSCVEVIGTKRSNLLCQIFCICGSQQPRVFKL